MDHHRLLHLVDICSHDEGGGCHGCHISQQTRGSGAVYIQDPSRQRHTMSSTTSHDPERHLVYLPVCFSHPEMKVRKKTKLASGIGKGGHTKTEVIGRHQNLKANFGGNIKISDVFLIFIYVPELKVLSNLLENDTTIKVSRSTTLGHRRPRPERKNCLGSSVVWHHAIHP